MSMKEVTPRPLGGSGGGRARQQAYSAPAFPTAKRMGEHPEYDRVVSLAVEMARGYAADAWSSREQTSQRQLLTQQIRREPLEVDAQINSAPRRVRRSRAVEKVPGSLGSLGTEEACLGDSRVVLRSTTSRRLGVSGTSVNEHRTCGVAGFVRDEWLASRAVRLGGGWYLTARRPQAPGRAVGGRRLGSQLARETGPRVRDSAASPGPNRRRPWRRKAHAQRPCRVSGCQRNGRKGAVRH